MKDTVLGTDPVRKIVSSGFKLKESESLGQISRDVYGRPDYWLLVGAINLEQGYDDFRKVTADTVIPGGKFIEIWKGVKVLLADREDNHSTLRTCDRTGKRGVARTGEEWRSA